MLDEYFASRRSPKRRGRQAVTAHSPPEMVGRRHGRPSIGDEERIRRFRNDKFGMFIHWGPFAFLTGEWRGHRVPVGTEAE